MKFVHLHVHSAYSLLNSTINIEDLVKKAAHKGYQALALTDENVMYGAILFYQACLRYNMKPIIGLTLSVQAVSDKSNEAYYPFVLLAKTNLGYRHLLKLTTLVQIKYKEGIPFSVLQHYSEGLIAISPYNGELTQHLITEKYQLNEANMIVETYRRLFKHDFYLGVKPHTSNQEESYNNQLIQLCKENNVSPVVTNPVHYLEKEDAIIHECLQCIKHGSKLNERKKNPQNEQFYLKGEETVIKQFQYLPEAVENTVNIAKQCNISLDLGRNILPKFPVPANITSDQYLRSLCFKGLEKRYKSTVSDAAIQRLEYELSVIQKMQFSDYFLIVWDFMSYAHKNKIITGPGRGSAAGSLVAYVLGITNVDPLKYNLLFERFLNPERITMPDIDIDFSDHRRDEMIQYVSEKYGKDHVAQIITFGTFGARASIRDVGRVLGISTAEVDRLAKLIPSRPGVSLNEAIQESPTLKKELSHNQEMRRVYEIALKIEGLPRHTSTHAAGVVISDEPLTDIVPLQEGHGGVLLTQFSMDLLEDIGLLKMDFLGLRNLSLIENIQHLIKKKTGQVIVLHDIPMNDSKTFELLGQGDTTGIFQLESAGMRKVLHRLKPTSFEDIVAVNALYRPGPMENIPTFIERKHGKRQVSYPHNDLKEILESTHGIIVYQEQIMQIASKMAGFTLGEADLLRRAVSKKKRDILEKEREHFIRGCLNNGYETNVAKKVYDLIVRFADYGFNKSHAVAYSIIAYWLAYLKANFPLFFSCAILSSAMGNEDKIAQYIGEAKQKKIKILPPSINDSEIQFTIEGEGIRFSLAPIKNVGMTAIKEILYQRKKKHFVDLFDFCARVSLRIVNRRVMESLILSGCFDEFGIDRAELLASIEAAFDYAELVNEEDGGFFLTDDIVPKPQYVQVEPFTTQNKLQFEKEVLGFYLSSHPIEPYQALLKRMNAFAVVELGTLVGSAVHIGALVVDQRTIKTKKEEQMAFLTLSDDSGEVAAVAFPRTFQQYSQWLKKGEILLIQGKVEEREQQLQLIINEVTSIKGLKEQTAFEKLYLKVEKSHQETGKLHQIKAILKQYPGTTAVYIYYAEDHKTVMLPKEWSAKLSEDCLKKLRMILGAKNVVIKK